MEPAEGFNNKKSQLLEKLMPIMDEYTLATLKIQQLKQKGFPIPHDLQMVLNKCAHEISGILLMP